MRQPGEFIVRWIYRKSGCMVVNSPWLVICWMLMIFIEWLVGSGGIEADC